MAHDPSERVHVRAYELWEAEGRPEGKHFEHWLIAERELGDPEQSQTPQTHEADAFAAEDAGGHNGAGHSGASVTQHGEAPAPTWRDAEEVNAEAAAAGSEADGLRPPPQ